MHTNIHTLSLLLSKIPLRSCLTLILFTIVIIIYPKWSLLISSLIVCIIQGTPEIVRNNIVKTQLIMIFVTDICDWTGGSKLVQPWTWIRTPKRK